MKRVYAIVILFLLFSSPMRAQFFSVGEEPARTKWMQLTDGEHPTFSVIYPRTSDTSISRRIAYDYFAYLHLSKTANGCNVDFTAPFFKTYPTVIHPYNASSNGVTLWSPRQIHFFSIPPVNITYPQSWAMQLGIHEGRHAWQMAHFNKGFWKIMSYIFGEQAVGMAGSIYPSIWFMEGDAVVAETEFGEVGRGTTASFLKGTLNSIIPEGTTNTSLYAYGKNRNWDRWRFGSVKHYSPNQYEVGYMINAMARYTSKDPDLADKILEMERRNPLNANIVANAFEKYSGHTHREYTKDSLLQLYYNLNTPVKFLKLMSEQPIEYKRIRGAESERVSGAASNYYTQYSQVREIAKDKFVAIVTSYGTTPYLILFENGKDEILRPMSYSAANLEVYQNRYIFWNEEVVTPRWGQVVESKIFCYDLQTRKVSAVEPLKDNGSREDNLQYLYNPVVQNDILYAIEYRPMSLSSSIVAVKDLKSNSDEKLKTIYTLEGKQITDFQKNGNSLYICAISNKDFSSEIYRIDNGSEDAVQLVKMEKHIIKQLILKGEKLYFLTDYFGRDVLCSITDNSNGFKIESSLADINSYDISNYVNNIYLTKFDGERGSFVYEQAAQNIALNPDTLEFTYPLVQELHRQFDEKLDAQRNKTGLPTNIKNTPYSKGRHLFHFHSWAPFFMDVSGATEGSFDEIVEDSNLGATVYSQNTLGTATTMFAYSYNTKEHRSGGHAKFTYSGWYPVIEANAHIGDKDTEGSRTSFRSSVSAYIPFNFSKNGWLSGVTPQITWSYKNYERVLYVAGQTPDGRDIVGTKLKDRHLLYAALGAYQVFPTSKAQYFPRLGIGGRLYAGISPNGGKYFGNIYAAYLYGYLPGFTFNQGFRLSAAYQKQDVKAYYLDNFIAEPRGYTKDIYANDYIRATIDYAIPIYLGDVSLGFFAYLKSVNIVPFADLGLYRRKMAVVNDAGQMIGTKSTWRNRSSIGVDVTFRTHLFRIGFPLSIGFRYARTYRPMDIRSYSSSMYKTLDIGSGGKNYFGLITEITFK